MKRRLPWLIIILNLFLQTVSAQEMVTESCLMTGEPALSTEKLNKKQTNAGWFYYVGSAASAGISWTRITNASLFPDTLVYQRYGGGTSATLGRVGTHSIGEIFDPKDFIYSTPAFYSKFNPYRWDSLAIMFRYSHNIPGTVDTLVINLYNEQNITLSTLQGSGRKVATVGYSKTENMGTGYTKQLKILIGADDSTQFSNTSDYNIKAITIPGGIDVKEGGLCGYTLTYIPGYSYSNGDTLQQDWVVPPVKKLNHFVYASWRDNAKLFNSGYNSGLKAITASRYTSDVWNNRYIPGHAWNDYDEIVNSQFYVRTDNYSVNNFVQMLTVSPNPVVAGQSIQIPENYWGGEIEIIDLKGNRVDHSYLNEPSFKMDFPAGIYQVRMMKSGMPLALSKLVIQP